MYNNEFYVSKQLWHAKVRELTQAGLSNDNVYYKVYGLILTLTVYMFVQIISVFVTWQMLRKSVSYIEKKTMG